jgi:prephenate dehydrogenase
VSDVASTKRRIAERAKDAGLRFVGGHPMAGLDQTGYEASTPDLFVDRPWVVCATDDLDATTRVEALARATGARPVRIDPATHDAAVAAISHLPLLVAAALVEAVLGEEAGSVDQRRLERDLAASGWRDATRLARGDVDMGAGIVATNADELAAGIRVMRDVLDRWLTDLERSDGPDVASVRGRLAAARDLLVGEAPASTPR